MLLPTVDDISVTAEAAAVAPSADALHDDRQRRPQGLPLGERDDDDGVGHGADVPRLLLEGVGRSGFLEKRNTNSLGVTGSPAYSDTGYSDTLVTGSTSAENDRIE